MAKSGGFKGNAQDYIDWFDIGYTDKNKIELPELETMSMIVKIKPESETSTLPDYKRYDLGDSYVQKHLDEHNEEYSNDVYADFAQVNMQGRGEMDEISTFIGSEMTEDEIAEERLKTQIYTNYDFRTKNPEAFKLPVQACKKEILEKIRNYSVVVVEGETGCGKSTQVPQFILDEAVEQHKHVNIIVTQPRKIAAISLANRVCDERGWKTGTIVGYQIGLNRECNEDTRIAYVTTEVFVQKAIHRKSLNDFTHIILDEVHERDEHTDFALLVVKKLLHTVSRTVKVVLMSATIDCLKFAKYFSTPVMGAHLLPAPIVSITDKTVHKVQIYYLENLSAVFPGTKAPKYDEDRLGIGEDMLQLCINLIEVFDTLERKEQGVNEFGGMPTQRGAVLVFVPGIHEIQAINNLLKLDSSKKRWIVFPLHSSLTHDEQKKVFERPNPSVRKIIVSTNIAESSITVPDIKYVIDFCLTKMITCDPVTNFMSLKMAWSSKSSCRQRAGRVGRVSSGRVYRLVHSQFYEELPNHPTPEICRTPLSSVVLKIKQLDMGEPKALLALALDPPNLANIYRTILVLKQIGCLTLKSGQNVSRVDGDLTYLGKVAAQLPLDPKLSKLIVLGYLFGVLHETVIIAAGISLKSFYSTPFEDELNAFLSKVSWAYGSFSDCSAIYNTFLLWESNNNRNIFNRNKKKLKKWAESSYVQLEAITDVEKLVGEIHSRLERLKLDKNIPEPRMSRDNSDFFVKVCLAGAFYPNYFKKSIPENYEETIGRELNGLDPFCTLVVSGLPAESNILYDDQLRTVFKDCSNDLTISFQGAKSYVQFPKRKCRTAQPEETHVQDIPGEFPTAMHLALKMKQVARIKKKLTIKLLSDEETEKRLKIMRQDSSNFYESSMRTVTQSEIELKPPKLPHPSEQMIQVRVTHVMNPSSFWVVIENADQIEMDGHITSTIKLNMDTLVNLPFICPKTPCLAPYSDPTCEETFYRGRVEEVYADENSALVYFVDFGNTAVLEIDQLKVLPESLLNIPILAIECTLSEVKPNITKRRSDMEKAWPPQAIEKFKEITLYRDFRANIYSVVHNKMHLELYKPQQMNMDNPSIVPSKSLNEHMIERGLALKGQELYLSKHNHELRTMLSFNSSSMNDGSLASSLTKCTLNASTRRSFGGTTTGYTMPIQIRGPDSPLEMRFTAISKTGTSKGVAIERNSVNSTALDLEPQNKFDTFLAAPFVVLNDTESRVILHNTTLMPTVPGMLSLSLLMFSPYVELRVDELNCEYTGALIGVGYDPLTHESIYPDDDAEICFDIKFNDDDLHDINCIRYLLSAILDRYDELSPDQMAHLRPSLRDNILKIFDEKKIERERVTFKKPYKWNQIPQGLKLEPMPDGSFTKRNVIYPLICGVQLSTVDEKKLLVANAKKLRQMVYRLRNEKALVCTVINEPCMLCSIKIKTVNDLYNHVSAQRHSMRENKLYGYEGGD